jgi:hypothetical protein
MRPVVRGCKLGEWVYRARRMSRVLAADCSAGYASRSLPMTVEKLWLDYMRRYGRRLEVAERVGFEPTVRFPVRSLSRRVLSTAQSPLRGPRK